MRGVYEEVTVTMTPSAAMTVIYGVLNTNKRYPLVETAEKIAFALGFECSPTKTEGGKK